MTDAILALAFIGLPILAWLIARQMTPVVIGLVIGFGLVGNLAQTSIGLGAGWNVRTLQTSSLLVMAAVVALALLWRSPQANLRRQIIIVLLPALAIGFVLIGLRMVAQDAGPMSAIGYFVNHPLAEDNAKWLHLSAQLADGRDISFSGYAGGPLLLLMSVMAALMSTLSTLWLGGVNEVAVAANTVLATQFVLIVLTPFAFSPFADRRLSVRRGNSSPGWDPPAPLIWAGMLVLFLASAVITSYGHLSLQFVLPVLALWILCFVTECSSSERLLATLAIVTLASVWFPLNALGALLLVVLVAWTIRKRFWLAFAAVVVTGFLSWDAIFSSIGYLLGLEVSAAQVIAALPFASSGSDSSAAGSSSDPVQLSISTHVFEAPGGTEILQPMVGIAVLAVVLAAVWVMSRRGLTEVSLVVRFIPVVALATYAVLIGVGDAISTGSGPNYGANKLFFAVGISVLAALLPLALTSLDVDTLDMTVLRWFAVGGVVVLLSIDTLLPRALSALSPVLWPAVHPEDPQYWSLAEVKDQPEQPVSSLPIACLFIPQGGEPTALPLGQESYACTRLLVGLGGLESKSGILPAVLQEDWLSNRSTWDARLNDLRVTSDAISNRTVIAMTPDGGVSGISVLSELLAQP